MASCQVCVHDSASCWNGSQFFSSFFFFFFADSNLDRETVSQKPDMIEVNWQTSLYPVTKESI